MNELAIKRNPLFDVVKFLAMLLVIGGHLRGNEIVAAVPGVSYLSNANVAVAMPCFFMISGYLAAKTFEIGNAGKIVARIVCLLWPLASFGLVFGLVLLFCGKVALWKMLAYPFARVVGGSWFLPTLASVYAMCAIERDLRKRVGGFDERYSFYEDYEFFFRLGLHTKCCIVRKISGRYMSDAAEAATGKKCMVTRKTYPHLAFVDDMIRDSCAMPIGFWGYNVVTPLLTVIVACSLAGGIVVWLLEPTLLRVLITTICVNLTLVALGWMLVLDRYERDYLLIRIKSNIFRIEDCT